MQKKYHVYGMGNALVDTEVEISEELLAQLKVKKGQMGLIDEPRLNHLLDSLEGKLHKRACGGSAANSLIAVGQLGGECFYSCKVAGDEIGAFYLGDLEENGVDAPKAQSEVGVTGRCVVMITPDAERSMETFLGITATFSENQINETALRNSEYLYIEGYLVAQETGKQAMIKAKNLATAHHVKTAITLSDPAMVEFFGNDLREVIGEGVDLLFCNEMEALRFTNTDTVQDACEKLKNIATAFAITLGSKGAKIYDGANFYDIDPHKIQPLDSNGAGDMFAGSFLYAITHGHDYLTAGNLASRTAAKVVSQFGPRLTKEETQAVALPIIG